MFKKRRGIRVPYNKQGLIHFTCLDVRNQPEEIQHKIHNLCIEVAGEDWRALYEAMTNDDLNIAGVAMKYYISEKKIYNYRKTFYEAW